MKRNIIVREIRSSDCKKISQAFKQQGWNKPESLYNKYLLYQKSGVRDIIIAEMNGEFSGYLTINWNPEYELFKIKSIPEIVDLNVLKKFQRQGIGSKLMDEAEKRIKKVSAHAGIGFGVTREYGVAQILYINRNYKPDGNGMVKTLMQVKYGDVITIDDDTVFYLIKKL